MTTTAAPSLVTSVLTWLQANQGIFTGAFGLLTAVGITVSPHNQAIILAGGLAAIAVVDVVVKNGFTASAIIPDVEAVVADVAPVITAITANATATANTVTK